MTGLNQAVLSIFILLSHVKLLCTGQLFPFNGNPISNSNGHLPENILESMRTSYRNGNLASSSDSNMRPPPALYPGVTLGSPIVHSGHGGISPHEIGASAELSHDNVFHTLENGAGGYLTGNPNNRYVSSAGSFTSPPSNSKSISGDYCFEPLLTCDTSNTVLYCIQGRCSCPTQWTLSPGSLPLNTVWHPEQKRCVSLVGSSCHVVTSSHLFPSSHLPGASRASSYYPLTSSSAIGDQSSSSQTKEIASSIIKGIMGMPSGGNGNGYGYVYCQPGVQCVRHPGYQEVGICAGCSIKTQVNYFIALVFLQLFLRYV